MNKVRAAGLVVILGAASLCAPGWAAGSRVTADGTLGISDDLTGGSAGGVGASGVGSGVTYSVAGSVGQSAAGAAASGTTSVESGYFSRSVLAPAAPSLSSVFVTSMTVSYSAPANPSGTLYQIQYSTIASFSISLSTSVSVSPITLKNLQQDTTYFVRIRSEYMGGDASGFSSAASTKTQTVPELLAAVSTPTFPANGSFISVQPNFNWIGASTATLALLGNGTQYLLEVSDLPDFSNLILDVSTAAAIQATTLTNANGMYMAADAGLALSDNTTYYWRVRNQTASGATGPFSDVVSFVTDFSDPSIDGFSSVNSTGGTTAEVSVNDLASGVTVQAVVQDLETGFAPAGSFSVTYSSDAGQTWFDGTWESLGSPIPGDGQISALAEYDGKLYAGTVGTGKVAFYNGTGWTSTSGASPIRPGVTHVLDLAVYKGKLYAVVFPGGTVAVYDGSSWAPTTGGQVIAGDTQLFALAVYNGKLYACSGDTGKVAVYDGTTWAVTNNNNPVIAGEPTLYALATYNGKLYVGSYPNAKVAVFDGNTWTTMNSNASVISGAIQIISLAAYNGKLYAGTGYGTKVAVFDGAVWSTANGGNPVLAANGAPGYVYSLAVFNGKLYGGTGSLGRVVSFDGRDWTAFGGGSPIVAGQTAIESLAVFQGQLYAGGSSPGRVARLTGVSAALSGAPGSPLPQTLQALDLSVKHSTNSETCGGSVPCGATNQVRFAFSDRAGNVAAAGPFAVLVDTVPPTTPSSFAVFQATAPDSLNLQWVRPGDDGSFGQLLPGGHYRVQYTTSPGTTVWSPANAQLTVSTEPESPDLATTAALSLPQHSGKELSLRLWAIDDAGNASVPTPVLTAFVSPFRNSLLDGASFDAAGRPALAIGRDGSLHLAYADSSNGYLRYSRGLDGVAVESGVVHSGANTGGSPSIAVDSSDRTHIAFYDPLSDSILYSTFTPGVGWSSSTVASGAGNPAHLALAVDAMGRPMIAYHHQPTSSLRLSSWNGTAWTAESVPSGPGAGYFVAMALDAKGVPHIAFDIPANSPFYAVKNGTAWSVTDIAAAFSVGGRMSIAVDGSGLPHIAYNDQGTGGLVLSSFDGGSWTHATVDTGSVGGNVSLALDGAGQPHIAYEDGELGDLKYAYKAGTWKIGTIDSVDYKNEPVLALDAAGNPQIAYMDTSAYDIRLASWTANAFSPPAGGSAQSRVQAPSAFRVVSVTSSTVIWAWTDRSVNETAFRLYGATSASGPFDLVAGPNTLAPAAGAGSELTLEETGLTPSATYFRYLVAANDGGVVASSGAMVRMKNFLGAPYISTPTYPADGSFVNLQPNFNWIGPSTAALSVIGAGAAFDLEVSSGDAGFSLANLVIRISTPVPALDPLAPAVTGVYLSTFTLTDAATYFWRIRLKDSDGSLSPYSAVAAFRLDFSSPTLSGFRHLNPTGTALSETGVNALAAGVTAQIDARDILSGLSQSPVSFQVVRSTDAGASFQTTPFVSLTGLDGSLLLQTISAHSLQLIHSTNTQTCGGTAPCGATNQVLFSVADRAGNVRTAGPFAVLVDTMPPAAPNLLSAGPGAAPHSVDLVWEAPGSDGPLGLLPAGSEFRIQHTTTPTTVVWSTANAQVVIATGPIAGGTYNFRTLQLPASESGKRLHVTLWARDPAGNWSAPSSAASSILSPFSRTRLDGAGFDITGRPALAVSRQGDQHVAYFDATSAKLIYRRLVSGSVAEEETVYSGDAESVTLALDAAGRPHIAFFDPMNDELIYSSFTAGSGWSAHTVDSGLSGYPYASLVVDAAGLARIAYRSQASDNLFYASWNGLGFDQELVSNSGGYYASLALDGAGTPHIAHELPLSSPYYAVRTASGWTNTDIDPAASAAGQMAIAIDGNGLPQVAFSDSQDNFALKHYKSDGLSWTGTTVDPDSYSGDVAMSLDGVGLAHILYTGTEGAELRYARFGGADSTETITVDGSSPALALDAAGNPVAVFVDSNKDVLISSWTAGLFAVPMAGSAGGRVQAPVLHAVPLNKVFKTSIAWSWSDNAADEDGYRLYGATSAAGPFALIADQAALPTNTTAYFETGLTRGTTYFRYVAAVNAGGVVTSSLFVVQTKGNDFIAPVIDASLQQGDSTWYRLNPTAGFNVQFHDAGGSGLDYFEVKASTAALDQAGAFVTIQSGISNAARTNDFTAPWTLPQAVFTALLDEATNFISVRVLDVDENITVSSDTFYVKKDTTAPRITPTTASYGPLDSDQGAIFAANVFDPGGIHKVQYSAASTPGTAATDVTAWTDISEHVAGNNGFAGPFSLNFAQLLNNATNYISLRAWDLAGTTRTRTDAFLVLKDTSGPEMAISVPSNGSFHSILLTISGTAFDLFGVQSVEFNMRRAFDGAYWNHSNLGFETATTPVWNALPGGNAWEFDATNVPFVSNNQYQVVVRGSNPNGTYSAIYATATFNVDMQVPAASVGLPADGSSVTSLAVIAGSASDPGSAPSGVGTVEMILRRLSDGSWWDTATDTWVQSQTASTAAVSPGQWSYLPSALLQASLRSNTSYYVTVKAADNALPPNSDQFFVNSSTFTFIDISSPAAVVDLVASEGGAIGEVALTWHATGDDGTSGWMVPATFLIQTATSSLVAASTGAAAVSVSTRAVATPGAVMTHTVSDLTPGNTYYFYVWTVDDAGNLSGDSNRGRSVAKAAQYLAGAVRQTDGEGITGVTVECFNEAGSMLGEGVTLPDGSGVFRVPNLPAGTYKVVVTWTVDDLSSSASKDGIPETATGVDFTLSIQYSLASITGQLQSLKAPARSGGPRLSGIRAAAAADTGAFVELYSKGRLVSAAPVRRDGSYAIRNLLPGTYQARSFDGQAYSPLETVRLREGQRLSLGSGAALLPEAGVFSFPNPAKEAVTLRFESSAAAPETTIAIYDVSGALVRELSGAAVAPASPGVFHAAWDTRNSKGKRVASGVYLFVVKVRDPATGGRAQVTKKLAVLR